MKAGIRETIAITSRGMPTPRPTLTLVDLPAEEPVVGDVLLVADAGKIQPFTWMPYMADPLWTVEVDIIQEGETCVANSTTSPELSPELHSATILESPLIYIHCFNRQT